MGEPVEQGSGQTLRAEHRGPLVERQVAGDQDRAALVAPAEDLEQEFRPARRQRHIAELVDDQQLVAGQLLVQAQEPPLIPGFQELMDQGLLSQKSERGLVLYLPDVLFEFDSADLTDAANGKIAAVAEIVVRLAPERTLSVEGHTDTVGDAGYNLELSLRRALAVSDALQAGGVAGARLRTVGHGERFPVADNRTPDGRDDPAGRAANRRVEVVIQRPS